MARLLALLSVLALVVLAAGFFRYFDRVPYQAWVGYHGAARTNDLLAAERLLRATGVRVRSFASLQGLPPSDATLVLPTLRLSLSEARNTQLLNWVRSGGHLVVVTWTLKSEGGEDPLLDPLGIEQLYNDFKDDTDYEKIYNIRKHVATVSDFGAPLTVHFDPRYSFKEAPPKTAWMAQDDYGLHALSLRLDKGRVTALTDADFMNNSNIGINDHAALFWHMLQHPRSSGEVWLVYAEDMPSLAELIWRYAWAVVVAGALLLAVFLWSRVPRFGPVLPVVPLARKRLSEHIVASGWLLWRHGHGESLLSEAREAVAQRLRWLRPDWIANSDREGRLAQTIQLPVQAGQQAFNARVSLNETSFSEVVRTLETIRKRL